MASLSGWTTRATNPSVEYMFYATTTTTKGKKKCLLKSFLRFKAAILNQWRDEVETVTETNVRKSKLGDKKGIYSSDINLDA